MRYRILLKVVGNFLKSFSAKGIVVSSRDCAERIVVIRVFQGFDQESAAKRYLFLP